MFTSLVVALALTSPAAAMEGMWRPEQLPELAPELKELGARSLDPRSLADTTKAPLGAVVNLAHCTGVFVSEDGLIATSYHCITSGLQYASRRGEDLFEDGFHARERGEERWAGPSERVRILLSSQDITGGVLQGTRKLEGAERLGRIEENIKKAVASCESHEDVHCEVAVYDMGAEYEIIKMVELEDVRLVYSPPRPVGYFGGSNDNWQWPRHSGDFAFLRAYARDGAPAAHNPGNQPYRPPAWVKTARQGPEPGEFVLTAGFPSETWRWRTAPEADYAQEWDYPRQIATNRDVLEILGQWSEVDPEIASKVAPRKLNLDNTIQYHEGTLAGFERKAVARDKWQLSRELEAWIGGDAERTAKYGDALSSLHRLEAEVAATGEEEHLIDESLENVAMLAASVTLWNLAVEGRKPDKQRRPGLQNRDRPRIKAELDEADATYDWRVDRALCRYFLLRMLKIEHDSDLAWALKTWLRARNHPGTLEAQLDAELDRLYDSTDLADPLKRRSLMETSPWYLTHSGNPWFDLAAALQPALDKDRDRRAARESEMRAARPAYMAAVREFFPQARPRWISSQAELGPGLFYSDANHTLRVSIGKVDGFRPRDGLIAEPRTRLWGILEKQGTAPYDAPETLLTAIRSENFGSYNSEDLDCVPVNFLTTVDSTRGTSGSPTLNARGEFVGILFDGNYEAIASDWTFDDRLTRTIHTDIAYVLWYLDAVASADTLLRELGIEPEFTGASGQP